MEEENSYESDLSESWSLIDINLNEETPSSAERPVPPPKPSTSRSKKVNLDTPEEREIYEFLRDCEGSNPSDTDSDSSCNSEGIKIIKKDSKENENVNVNVNDGVNNDSEDTESIEVLGSDEHEARERENHNYFFYYRFDFGENRQQHEDSSDPDESNDGFRNHRNMTSSWGERYDRYGRRNFHPSFRVYTDEENENRRHYFEYANTFVLTFIQLSFSVIIAGAASIVISQYFAIRNPSETRTELAEAVKELRMENAALEARFPHITKDSFPQETDTKELPVVEPLENTYEESSTYPSSGNIGGFLSEIALGSKYLEYINGLVDKMQEKIDIEMQQYRSKGFLKTISEQIETMKGKHECSRTFARKTDRVLAVMVRRMLDKFFSLYENIEVLYQKAFNIKPEAKPEEVAIEESEPAPKISMTEDGIEIIEWEPEKEKNNEVEYQYPKLEKYYESELNQTEKSEIKKNKKKDKQKREKKEKRKRVGKKENIKKNNLDSLNEAKIQYQKLENKNGKPVRRVKKFKKGKKILVAKNEKDFIEKTNRKYSEEEEEDEFFNQTGFWVFKWADGRREFRRHHTPIDWQFERAKARKKTRDVDHNNWQFERAKGRKKVRDVDDDNWQFERAKGRKKVRDLDDDNWQFERAKGRKKVRDLDDDNWQFERAKARKTLRDDDVKEKDHFKRVFAEHIKKNDERWHSGKGTKYNKKEFFHPWH